MSDQKCRCGKPKGNYCPMCDQCTIEMGEFIRNKKYRKPVGDDRERR